MHILFVTNGTVPHLGGKSSHICDLQDGLIAIGIQASVISYTSLTKVDRIISKAMKLFIVPFRLANYDIYQWYSLKITDIFIHHRVKAFLKKHEVDLISAQDPASAISMHRLVGDKIPIALTMHSYFGKGMEDLNSKNAKVTAKYYEKVGRRDLTSLRFIKELIAVDTRIQEDCTEHKRKEGVEELEVSMIPNFVNITKYCEPTQNEREESRSRLGIPENVGVIICIRRLVDKNGVIFAVEAMKNVDNAILLVGGDGPNAKSIKEYIMKNNLENKVRLLGGVDGQLKNDVYRVADIAVVPSITIHGLQEATSISAIEAMATGIPLVASSIGGLKQLITDKMNGCLVEERNSEEIAKAINYLLHDEKIKKVISANGRRTIELKYSHVAGASAYLKIYERAIKQYDSGRRKIK